MNTQTILRPEPIQRESHPIRTPLALVGISLAVTLAGALAAQLVAPDADALLRRLPVVLALLAMALFAVRRIGWRDVAAGGPSTWRNIGLLAVPVGIALVPLAWGWAPDTSTLAALATGYAATGLYEELWFRGVLLRSALPLGPVRASVVTAVFFGAAHLANIAFGANVAITVAQGIGAASGGFGYAILRQRTNAVWALAAIHFVSDLLFHTTGLQGGALWAVLVGHDVAILIVGLFAMRGLRKGA